MDPLEHRIMLRFIFHKTKTAQHEQQKHATLRVTTPANAMLESQ